MHGGDGCGAGGGGGGDAWCITETLNPKPETLYI